MIKTIKLPDNWKEVTVSQFQELAQCDNPIDKICVLSNEEREVIEVIDTDSANRIWEAINWVEQLPTEQSHSEVITVKGVEYKFRKLSSLSYGEWVDVHEYLKDEIQNLHKIISVFFKPEQEQHRKERDEIFKDNLNFDQAYGTLLFFSRIESVCLVTIRAYFQKEILLRQMSQKAKEEREKPKKERQKNTPGTYSLTALLKGTSLSIKKYLA